MPTRMGHDSERAALIYQHEARGADRAITDAIDRHIKAEQDDDEDATAQRARSSRRANGTLMARKINNRPDNDQGPSSDSRPDLGLRRRSG
jgi:hypothetical protein